jgi:SAM-dependent methyltransferase
VLDVGCGVGDVSFLAAAIVGPEGSVVGVDLDAEALKVAEKRRGEQEINNVELHCSDARSVDPGRLFDAAVGRFVLMFMSDPTAALKQIAERIRPGGIVAFHEMDGRVATALAMNRPVLARLQDLFARTFECSGARPELGGELYWRMLDAGLEPEPKPLVEIAVHMDHGEVAYRRWALFARSLLPKIVEYGLATEGDILDIIDHQLRDELVPARGITPLSWLMIAQWARKPIIGSGSAQGRK